MKNSFTCELFNLKLIKEKKIKFSPQLRIGEDFEFFVKVLVNSNKVVYLDENVYYYYDENNELVTTKTISDDKALDFGEAIKSIDAYLKEKKVNTSNIKKALKSLMI